MSGADTRTTFQSVIERFDVIDMVASSGWTGSTKFDQRDAIIQSIVLNELIYKRRAGISQLREGLASLEVLKIMQMYPEILKPLLVYDSTPMTLTMCTFLV